MQHRKKGRKLNRTASHKKALLRNLANQLFEHKEIRTTTAKAKEARGTVERLITYAKKGDSHHRRLAFSFLRNKDTIKILFDEIAPAYDERQGGYTRVLKLGRRQGDGAPVSLLQLVGFEKLADTSKSEKKKKSRKKEVTAAAPESETPKVVDTKSKEDEEIQEAEVVETVPAETEAVEPVAEDNVQDEPEPQEPESKEDTDSEEPEEEKK